MIPRTIDRLRRMSYDDHLAERSEDAYEPAAPLAPDLPQLLDASDFDDGDPDGRGLFGPNGQWRGAA